MNPPAAPDLSASLHTLFAETPETLTLDNGLTVVFQQDPAHPLFSAQVWIRTGSIHEEASLGSGLTHFLEHMLFKGTERRGPSAIAHDVQVFGGQINAYTAFDRTVYYIDGPAESLATALEILEDMTLHSVLPEDEVIKERDVILREIDMTLDDPDRILSRALFSTAFRVHPCRFPVIGLRPLFERVDRSILWDYYQARYHPANMVLSVAGDFAREALLDALAATFGRATPRAGRPVLVPAEPLQLSSRETRLSGDYETARGLLGYKIPSMRDADAPALDIMAAIIGSGHSGRLRQKLREELGLVHTIGSSSWNPLDAGLFFTQFQCAPEKAAQAESAIMATFHDFAKEGFTMEDLRKAQRFAFVSEVQSRQTTSGLASRLGLLTALVGDVHYPKRYLERILSLEVDELRALAGRTFEPDRLTVATLLPKGVEARLRPARRATALEPFAERTLPNGARLLWQRDSRLPRTWLRFAGLGGPLYEDHGFRGATSLMSTLLTRDTRFRTAYEVARDLESEGGFLTEFSGNNSYSLAVEVIPERIEEGLRALSQAVLYPAFKPATIAREREAQLAHLSEIKDDILDFARLSLRERFFGDHPFASTPFGSPETVARMDQAYLKCLYNRLIVAPNSVLVVTGDFDPDRLLPRLEAFLQDLPAQGFRRRTVPFAGPACTGEFSEVLHREQAVVLEAYPDVGFKPESELVGEVLDELLSDMSGPLFRAVREDQSLAYYVGASRLLGSTYGSFFLYAGTQPASTREVYACFDRELERIRKGQVTNQELAATRTRLKVHNRFSLQSAATRAARVALNALYDKPLMDWLTYEERLDALSPQDLTDFANEHLIPGKRLRLTVGPEND